MKKAKKIFIPFSKYTSIGGPATFMSTLKRYLDKIKFGYTQNINQADALFFPISYDLEAVDKVNSHGGKILQRLDGIYYPSKHGEMYLGMNSDIREIYLRYADHVIFQSEYSRKQCFEVFGELPREKYTIIHNGTDNELFYPEKKELQLKENITFVTTGNFRNIDMIEPLVNALDLLQNKYNIRLAVVGPVVDPELACFFERPYIVDHGPQSLKDTAAVVRQADIFIYSHLNPPCPNSVIEAISSGIPVVAFDSGSLNELCFFNRELLAPVSDEIFQKYSSFHPERLAEKIELCIQNYPKYKKSALSHAHHYSSDTCGQAYEKVFKSVLDHHRSKFKNRIKNLLMSLLEKPVLFWLSVISDQKLMNRFLQEISKRISKVEPSKALEYLFKIDSRLYKIQGQKAVDYGNGHHTKHKHTNYHKFFIDHISANSRVLDVGCGKGELAADIADNVENVYICAIDLNRSNIKHASASSNRPNIDYICGNALKQLPDENFDTIILSNVLEHIKKRVPFLTKLKEKYAPGSFLIRVPAFERDWRVPLKEELGLDYRLDPTHYTEYRYEQLEHELSAAGLHPEFTKIAWGEIWAVVRGKNTE